MLTSMIYNARKLHARTQTEPLVKSKKAWPVYGSSTRPPVHKHVILIYP